jgi:hypothetical protein
LVPTAVGVNVSATVQVPEAATGLEVEHVVPEAAMAKGPVVVITVKVRLAVPVLVTVTVCAGLVVPTGSDGKVGAAEKLSVVVAAVPVPLKLAVCVLPVTPPALSVTVRVAAREPAAPGVKVTLIVQEPDAATGLLVEQVVPVEATAKSLALVPEMAMLAIVRAEVVGLLSVKV